jgi:hypothetical protein
MDAQLGDVHALVDQMRGLCELLQRQREQNVALREQASRIRARSQWFREARSGGSVEAWPDIDRA